MTIGLTAALTMGNASGTALWSAGAGEASASAAQARFTQARDDNPVLYADGCHLDYEHVTSPECVFGDPRSATTVVLFGDSHAAHWFPALERIASEERWRLVSLTKSGCPSVDVAIRDLRIGRRYVECETWRHNSLARIQMLRPSLVVLTNAHDYVEPSAADPFDPTADPLNTGAELAIARTSADWLAGLQRTLRTLGGFGLQTVVLRDSPWPRFDVPTCLARQAWRPWLYPDGCRFARGLGIRQDIVQAEDRAVSASRNVSIVDLSSAICRQETCDTTRGDVVMYRDHHHLTARFSTTLAPVLAVQLKRRAELVTPLQ